MLKTLIKKQLLELNRSFFYDSKKGKLRSKLASAVFILAYAFLMVGILGICFAYLSYTVCEPFTAAGLDWLYFSFMTLIAIALGVFGSVFNTYSSLYKSNDNDLLLSLPIPVRHILISRLIGVYLMGLMFSGVVMLPALIVYYVVAKPGALAVFGSILLTLLISVFVLVLSCLLGWVVAKISARLKNRSLVIVVLSLLFIAAYYYIYYKASAMLQTLLLSAVVFGEEIKDSAAILYFIGLCGTGDILAMIFVTAAVLALFALTWRILSRSFLKIATASDAAVKVKYRERTSRRRSPRAALLYKELRRFLSSSNYMLNCALGTLAMPICAVLILVKGDVLIRYMSEAFGMGADLSCAVLAVALCFVVAMNDITAPSVSLEGKNLWIVQSLPVDMRQVLCAKLELHLLLTAVPALLCSLSVCAVFDPSPAMAVLSTLLPLLFALFGALGGLAVSLIRPNLSWTSEISAVKQSFSVLAVLLGGWVVAGIMAFAFYKLYDTLTPLAFLACCCVLLCLICLLLWRILMTRGAQKLRFLAR